VLGGVVVAVLGRERQPLEGLRMRRGELARPLGDLRLDLRTDGELTLRVRRGRQIRRVEHAAEGAENAALRRSHRPSRPSDRAFSSVAIATHRSRGAAV